MRCSNGSCCVTNWTYLCIYLSPYDISSNGKDGACISSGITCHEITPYWEMGDLEKCWYGIFMESGVNDGGRLLNIEKCIDWVAFISGYLLWCASWIIGYVLNKLYIYIITTRSGDNNINRMKIEYQSVIICHNEKLFYFGFDVIKLVVQMQVKLCGLTDRTILL